MVDTGFTVIGVLGEGTVWSMPTVEGRTVCPNDLGTQTYLSLLYRYARLVVMRYKHHVKVFPLSSRPVPPFHTPHGASPGTDLAGRDDA